MRINGLRLDLECKKFLLIKESPYLIGTFCAEIESIFKRINLSTRSYGTQKALNTSISS